jgi:hypothetical protein
MTYSVTIDNVTSKSWGLSIQEAYLFAWIYTIPSWASRVSIENKDFYYASKNKAIADLPLLSDKIDTIYRYYKSLEALELIELKKVDGKDFISLTEKAKTWNCKSERSENNPTELGKESDIDSDLNPTNYSINNNYNIRDKKICLKDFDFSKELTSSSNSYKKNINRIGAVYSHLKDEDPNNITLVDHELLSDWMYAAEKLEAIDDKSFSRMFAFAKRHKFWGDKITGLPFLAKNWDKILIDYRKEG